MFKNDFAKIKQNTSEKINHSYPELTFIFLSPVKLPVDSSGNRTTDTLDFYCITFYCN